MTNVKKEEEKAKLTKTNFHAQLIWVWKQFYNLGVRS